MKFGSFFSDSQATKKTDQKKLLRKRSTDIRQINVEQLEIDRMEKPFGFFPLLDGNSRYFPDTEDLTKDTEAREYWLTCFEGLHSITDFYNLSFLHGRISFNCRMGRKNNNASFGVTTRFANVD